MLPVADNVPTRCAPVATWLLIAGNSLVFLLMLGLDDDQVRRLFYLFGIVPARYTHPHWAQAVGFPIDSYWPFLTSQFLHSGWLHIISNMWILWLFGDNVEDRMGPLRFVLFYLTCGVAAGLLHWATNPHSTVPAVGASGAIAGVIAAYAVLHPFARILILVPVLFYPFFFAIPATLFALFWFATQFFSGTLSLLAPTDGGGVAWWAHIGGFAAGLLILPLFVRNRPRPRHAPNDAFYRAWTR